MLMVHDSSSNIIDNLFIKYDFKYCHVAALLAMTCMIDIVAEANVKVLYAKVKGNLLKDDKKKKNLV